MSAGAETVWKLDVLNELWRESLDSYDRAEDYVLLDGDMFYRLVIDMLLDAGAIDHPGQVIDEAGPGMTSAVSLLYAHDPKEVVESAMIALQESLKDLA